MCSDLMLVERKEETRAKARKVERFMHSKQLLRPGFESRLQLLVAL